VVAAKAVEALSAYGLYDGHRIATVLAGLLRRKDASDTLKVAAIRSLRSCGSDAASAAVRELAQLIESGIENVGIEAAKTLEDLGVDGRPAVAKLVQVIRDPATPTSLRDQATRALTRCAKGDKTDLAIVGTEPAAIIDALRALGQSDLKTQAGRLRRRIERMIDHARSPTATLPPESPLLNVGQSGSMTGGRQKGLREGPREQNSPPQRHARSDAIDDLPENLFRRVGKTWTISFEGKQIAVPHRVGLDYIAMLLAHPGKTFSATELRQTQTLKRSSSLPVTAEECEYAVAEANDLGAIPDDTAIKRYETELARCKKDLEEAEQAGQTAKANEIQRDIDHFEGQLRQTRRPGGRKTNARSRAKKDADAVRIAIDRVLQDLKSNHRSLWEHLNGSLDSGAQLSYRPGPSIEWTL
jgi:hypothetical protein